MRHLLLVLNLIIGSALVSLPAEVVARQGAKAYKHKLQHSPYGGHSARHRGKPQANQKGPHRPGDVWERIRYGMQIPRPAPPAPLYSQPSAVAAGETVASLPPSASDKKQSDLKPLLLKLDPLIPETITPSKTDTTITKTTTDLSSTATPTDTASTTAPTPEQLAEQQKKLAEQQELLAQQRELEEQRRAKQNDIYQRVAKRVGFYSQRRGIIYSSAERARPYLHHIVNELDRNKLPLELALLPIMESAYQPTALSPKNAAGIWQFIPSTGKIFGLEQNEWYDGRLDIAQSTQAAIRFLSALKRHFKGDWLLALAAYNCGQGTVDNAISRNREAGLETDFWSLNLPGETEDYVPRFLALATLFSNPNGFRLRLKPIRNELYFIKAKIDRKIDLELLAQKDYNEIARLANLTPEQFRVLNPGFLTTSPPAGTPLSLSLPIGNANTLHEQLALLAQPPAEPLNLALSTTTNAAVNPVLTSTSTTTDQTATSATGGANTTAPTNPNPLQNPVPSPIQISSSPVKPVAIPAALVKPLPHKTGPLYNSIHYVDYGETLAKIAQNFDVSVEAIRELNKLKRRQEVTTGQALVLPAQKQASSSLAEGLPVNGQQRIKAQN